MSFPDSTHSYLQKISTMYWAIWTTIQSASISLKSILNTLSLNVVLWDFSGGWERPGTSCITNDLFLAIAGPPFRSRKYSWGDSVPWKRVVHTGNSSNQLVGSPKSLGQAAGCSTSLVNTCAAPLIRTPIGCSTSIYILQIRGRRPADKTISAIVVTI